MFYKNCRNLVILIITLFFTVGKEVKPQGGKNSLTKPKRFKDLLTSLSICVLIWMIHLIHRILKKFSLLTSTPNLSISTSQWRTTQIKVRTIKTLLYIMYIFVVMLFLLTNDVKMLRTDGHWDREMCQLKHYFRWVFFHLNFIWSSQFLNFFNLYHFLVFSTNTLF